MSTVVARFSVWLDPLVMQKEIQVGKPVLPESEKELAKLLSRIPSFLDRGKRWHRRISNPTQRLHFGPSKRGLAAAYTILGKRAITLRLHSGTIRGFSSPPVMSNGSCS